MNAQMQQPTHLTDGEAGLLRTENNSVVTSLAACNRHKRKNEKHISQSVSQSVRQSVDEVTRLRARRRKCPSLTGRDKRTISPPKRPRRPWSTSSRPLFIGTGGPHSRRYSGRGMKLATCFTSVLKLGIRGAILPLLHLFSWRIGVVAVYRYRFYHIK